MKEKHSISASEREKLIVEIFYAYRREFIRYIRKRFYLRQEDAEEIYHLSFWGLLLGDEKETVDISKGFPRAYFYQIVRNQSIKYMKKNNLFEHYNTVDISSAYELEGGYSEIDEELIEMSYETFHETKEPCKTIISLRDGANPKTMKEIKEIIGYKSVQAVINKYSSCKKMFKENLEKKQQKARKI